MPTNDDKIANTKNDRYEIKIAQTKKEYERKKEQNEWSENTKIETKTEHKLCSTYLWAKNRYSF